MGFNSEVTTIVVTTGHCLPKLNNLRDLIKLFHSPSTNKLVGYRLVSTI